MTVQNAEIADRFEQLADLLELQGANPFRVRAYRNAARFIRGHSRSLAELLGEGANLADLPGIGPDLADKIATLVRTGHLPLLEQTAKKVPGPLVELTRIEGLGPKRAQALYKGLRIRSLEDLARAARSGRIRELPGFGARTEQLIAQRVERAATAEHRLRLADAEQIARPLVAYLRGIDGVKDVELAGSFRRRRETVGDLDVLVSAARGAKLMDGVVSYEDVAEVQAQGSTRATLRLRNGLQVDVRVVPAAAFGSALHYFTGSKAHNIAVRRMAMERGLKLNEYGLFRGERRVGGRTEAEVFAAVGLPVIPPELREDRGEIEAARRGKLPKLVRLEDLRGDLHCHSRATDGRDTIEAMAKAAAAHGYEYLSINDHSRHVTVAHGLDRKRLLEQVRAMDNPHFSILAHPTGRLINAREAYDIDLERVLEAARERGCVMELNAQPDRLDLDDRCCRLAKEIGVRVAISSDAHRVADLDLMRFGVDQARRGWLEPGDVVNTLPLQELRRVLRSAR